MSSHPYVTVITGASKGIGLATQISYFYEQTSRIANC